MKLLSFCTDKRTFYAAQFLSRNFDVTYFDTYANLGEVRNKKFDILLTGMPCTKDGISLYAPNLKNPPQINEITPLLNSGGIFAAGMIAPATRHFIKNEGFICLDYADENLTLQNAKLTAEAAVAIAINSTEKALCDSRILISGFGRIAKYLSGYLKAFGAEIIIAARSKEARTNAASLGYTAIDINRMSEKLIGCDIIFNTVPAAIFGQAEISAAKGAVYIELASVSGISEEYHDSEIRVIFAPSLPGKYSPFSAGKLIAESVNDNLQKINFGGRWENE